MSILLAALTSASLLSFATAQGTITLELPLYAPDGASAPVNPSFAGFGIEPSNLFSFTGYAEPNMLSINLLQNLADYTGVPPHIRLGGNTQDYMHYSASQTEWTWINNPNAQNPTNPYGADHMLIGPRFYQAANRFPKGTPITYGLNMAYEASDYVEQITTMAKMAMTTFTNLNLVSFEIGNEPDLWLANGFRTGSWTGQDYTDQWLDRAWHVYNGVLKPAGLSSQFFEAAQTASTIGTTFQIDDLVTAGITENANGTQKPYLASWNQHDYYYYIGVSTYPLTLYHFMTLSTTKDQFVSWVQQIDQSQDTPFPYALREMGVVGPIGMTGITDVFAAALWTLNFFLYTTTLNISSVQMHMTDNSNASAWQPINAYGIAPFVRPNYYGFAAFDQIIGPSCQARVVNNEIGDLPDEYGGRVEAYSIYQNDTLASVVIINSQMANVSDTDKQSLTVQLTLPTEYAGQELYLAYLNNTGADARFNTTWNGLSFEENGDGTSTQIDDTVLSVTIGSDGTCSITVRDTQAVVGSVGIPVGQVQSNESACAGIESKTSTLASAATTTNAANSLTGPMGISLGEIRISAMILTTLITSFITGGMLLLA